LELETAARSTLSDHFFFIFFFFLTAKVTTDLTGRRPVRRTVVPQWKPNHHRDGLNCDRFVAGLLFN